jgi:hypothetical protein
MVRFLLPMNLEFTDQRPESLARILTTMRGDFLDRGRIRLPDQSERWCVALERDHYGSLLPDST